MKFMTTVRYVGGPLNGSARECRGRLPWYVSRTGETVPLVRGMRQQFPRGEAVACDLYTNVDGEYVWLGEQP